MRTLPYVGFALCILILSCKQPEINNANLAASLSVVDAADASLLSLQFGARQKGVSSTKYFFVKNSSMSSSPLQVDSVKMNSSDGPFTVLENSNFLLSANEKRQIEIRFKPMQIDAFVGRVIVYANAFSTKRVELEVTGNSPPPSVNVITDSIIFPPTAISGRYVDTVKLYNPGPNQASINYVCDDPSHFKSATQSVSLPSGDTARVQISFEPDLIRTYHAQLVISISGNPPYKAIFLTGTSPAPLLTTSPSNNDTIRFSRVTRGETKDTVVQLGNASGSINRLEWLVRMTGGTFSCADTPAPLVPGQTKPVHIRFSPPARGQFQGTIIFISNSNPTVSEIFLSGEGI